LLIPLSIKQVPIDDAKVAEGMYVSKLDRLIQMQRKPAKAPPDPAGRKTK
jgi:hypothetical protein